MNSGTPANKACRVVSPKIPVAEHVFCVGLLFDNDLAKKTRSRYLRSIDSSNATHRDFSGVPLRQIGAPEIMNCIRAPEPQKKDYYLSKIMSTGCSFNRRRPES
jgi:hypothetical protein